MKTYCMRDTHSVQDCLSGSAEMLPRMLVLGLQAPSGMPGASADGRATAWQGAAGSRVSRAEQGGSQEHKQKKGGSISIPGLLQAASDSLQANVEEQPGPCNVTQPRHPGAGILSSCGHSWHCCGSDLYAKDASSWARTPLGAEITWKPHLTSALHSSLRLRVQPPCP